MKNLKNKLYFNVRNYLFYTVVICSYDGYRKSNFPIRGKINKKHKENNIIDHICCH